MQDATRSVLDLWDATDAVVGRLRPEDWSRPLALPGMDVFDLTVHLAGVHYAGPERLREAMGAARARVAAQLADRISGDRVLGAQCLDMCLHAHDLGRAVGHPVDLADHAPAALEACRLIVDVAPRLLVAATGARDSTVRLRVRGDGVAPDVERTIHVADGHLVPASATAGTADVVDIDPVALLLLLSGRRGAETLRDEGSAHWSGDAADCFVHEARLLST